MVNFDGADKCILIILKANKYRVNLVADFKEEKYILKFEHLSKLKCQIKICNSTINNVDRYYSSSS